MSDAGLLRVEGIRSHLIHVHTSRAEPIAGGWMVEGMCM